MTGQPEHTHPVIVVDDDAGVRAGMLALLAAAGHAAEAYPDAAAALAHARPAGALCAVLDIHIGVPDGFALGTFLRLRAPGLPIVFISGADDPALARRASSAGAIGLLRKPVDGDDLLALIEALAPPVEAP